MCVCVSSRVYACVCLFLGACMRVCLCECVCACSCHRLFPTPRKRHISKKHVSFHVSQEHTTTPAAANATNSTSASSTTKLMQAVESLVPLIPDIREVITPVHVSNCFYSCAWHRGLFFLLSSYDAVVCNAQATQNAIQTVQKKKMHKKHLEDSVAIYLSFSCVNLLRR